MQRNNSAISQLGKIPPQALDLEQAILGAILIEKDAIAKAIDYLKPESFYQYQNQVVFKTCLNLFEKGKPIDILTVCEELKPKLPEIGGRQYLIDLTNKVATSANIVSHSMIVAEKYILRELIRIGAKVQANSFEDEDPFEALEEAEKDIYSLRNHLSISSGGMILDIVPGVISSIEEASNRGFSGMPTGFIDLDRKLLGIEKSDLMILAARPGMGKTAMMLNIAVKCNEPVVLFSLEMSKEQLVKRLISSYSGIDGNRIRSGNLEKHEWVQLNLAATEVENLPIYIDDTPSLSIYEFRARCRMYANRYGSKMVIADYLQLFQGSKTRNRENEISEISSGMKSIAKELNIPVIALSQLSRAVETRGGVKKPILSDLRESGSIEQEADQVVFIYRPEYYGIMEDEEGQPTSGIAEIIVAKNRHGDVGPVRIGFDGSKTKFYDLSEIDNPF